MLKFRDAVIVYVSPLGLSLSVHFSIHITMDGRISEVSTGRFHCVYICCVFVLDTSM